MRDHKFTATLKPRLDREIEDWHKAQPTQPSSVIYKEEQGSSQLGGPISFHHVFGDEQNRD